MVQIVITPTAQGDLADIFKQIAKDSYKNAEVVSEAIIKKVDVLHKYAHSGQIVKEFNNPSITELKLFKYRIIYRIQIMLLR